MTWQTLYCTTFLQLYDTFTHMFLGGTYLNQSIINVSLAKRNLPRMSCRVRKKEKCDSLLNCIPSTLIYRHLITTHTHIHTLNFIFKSFMCTHGWCSVMDILHISYGNNVTKKKEFLRVLLYAHALIEKTLNRIS